MGCCPPGSLVHVILQARILEWLAISFSRGSSWPRDQTWVSSSWCNNIINKVPNKCDVHKSPWNHFSHLPSPWKNCLSGNQSLVPGSLGAAVYSKDSMMMITQLLEALVPLTCFLSLGCSWASVGHMVALLWAVAFSFLAHKSTQTLTSAGLSTHMLSLLLT